MTPAEQYLDYLKIIAKPDNMVKVARLDFLNPDGTTAFSIDNDQSRAATGYSAYSRAFLQSGDLSVSLQNGKRRQASISFENLDRQFDYAANHIWFGDQVSLFMGVMLSDGTPYYLPQGVFYFDAPTLDWRPSSRQADYTLVDKWSYLDGSLFGNLRDTYLVPRGSNIFDAMLGILQLSRYTLEAANDSMQMIDNVPPLFTDYFNTRTTTAGSTVYANNIAPYDISVEYGQTYAAVITQLNDIIAGWIGYDQTGRLTVLPSEDDIDDQKKPILWDYTTDSKTFLGLSETSNLGEVCNEYTIVGEALDSDIAPVGRAINNDAASDTNIGAIGRKSKIESASGYYTKEQCAALAAFKLKRTAVLKKSVTISSTQLFHLQENNLITVKRSDKDGSPVERHLIQSFTLPISQTGEMSITATSVTDYPNITIEEVDYGINV